MMQTPEPASHRAVFILRETLAAVLFLAAAALLAFRFHHLPVQIHTPINGGGDVHGMGSREQIWLLIIVGGWIYVLMSLFNLLPPWAIHSSRLLSEQQRAKMLIHAKVFMGWFKCAAMAGLFGWIVLLVR